MFAPHIWFFENDLTITNLKTIQTSNSGVQALLPEIKTIYNDNENYVINKPLNDK